jgi:hypothetical protein
MMILHCRPRSAPLAASIAVAASLITSALAEADSVWVFLRDKDVNSGEEIQSAILESQRSLTPQAAARRSVRGMPASANDVAISDLPVASEYVGQIGALGASVRVQSKWLNAVSIDAAPQQLAQISRLPFVDHVQPVIGIARPQGFGANGGGDNPATPDATNDFYGAASAQLNQINVPAVHALGFTGTGMRIGILDSGFKRTHEAFNQPGHQLNVLAEHDFIEGDTFTGETNDDQHAHGTYVLGTIGAYQPNVIVGGAYDASFLLAKTEIVPTETQVEEDYWVAGLEYLEANGADIVTSSLGYIDWYTQAQLNGQTAVTTVAARAAAQRGLVITNAAGNEGHDANPATSHLIAPADADLLITVGAVDANGIAAGFTSDGPTADGRVKPELMARGVAASTVRANSDSGTTDVNGTSFATPLVASAVTLVIQAHPDWSIEQLRYALFNTASRNGVFDPQYVHGYGILNTLEAVQYSFDKYYTSSSSGSFATGTNWTSAGVPIGVHNVFISPTNSLTVSGPSATTRIHRLALGATGSGQIAQLNLSGGSAFTVDDRLSITGAGKLIVSSGSLEVFGTTTNHGIIEVGSSAQLADVTGTGIVNALAGSAVSARSIRQYQLQVGGNVTLAQNFVPAVSRVNVLNITGGATPTGKLDLKNNALVVDYSGTSQLNTVAAQVAFANHGGAWDRAGITTSLAPDRHAVGYAEASVLASIPSLFGSVDSTSLLLRYTILGDADLNGSVEFSDLLALAQNYGESGSSYWFEGDFNYDRTVEFADLLTLAQNYGFAGLSDGQAHQLSAAAGDSFGSDWAAARSLVPEPATAIGLFSGPILLRRRRRIV